MEIENGELTSLLGVVVNISIVRLNDSEDSSQLFTTGWLIIIPLYIIKDWISVHEYYVIM